MTLKNRRQFNREFKLQVLREIEVGKTVAQAAREYQLRPNLIGRWRKQISEYGDGSFASAGHAYTESARIAELERKVGQLTMEADLLKKPWRDSRPELARPELARPELAKPELGRPE